MTWTIRRATLDDAAVVVEFNCRLAQETEGKELQAESIAAGVAAALADPAKSLYFVAEEGRRFLLGQIMITFEWSDWRNGWIWWIQSVYVRPEARRRGVFRSLFEHVRNSAEKRPDVVGLRLYVDSDNASAQETYYRLGMQRSNYFVLEKYPL